MAAGLAPEVYERFLEQLAKLGTVQAVLRLEGMPSRPSIQSKIKRDPVFAARVEALWRKDPRGSTFSYPPQVWEAFLAKLEELGTIHAATRLEGMPVRSSVELRIKRDQAFAARVKAASRWQESSRSPIDWYRFLAKLEELGVPNTVCQLPGMPSARAFQRKRHRDPLFARRVDAIWRRRRYSAAVWDQFVDHLNRFGISEASDQPGMPKVGTVLKRRQIDPAFNARVISVIRDPANRHLHRYRYDDRDWDAFLTAAAGSQSLQAACGSPDMPSEGTVFNHARVDPGFRAALADIIRRQTKARIELQALRRKPTEAKRGPKPNTFAGALSRDQIYAAVATAVPKTLPPITRDDIICDMVLAVLEGQIAVGEIKARSKDFVREHWRMFGTLRDLSLDAALFDDGAGTIGDRVAGHGADYW